MEAVIARVGVTVVDSGRGVRDRKVSLGTFTCGNIGTIYKGVGRAGRSLIIGLIGLRIVRMFR